MCSGPVSGAQFHSLRGDALQRLRPGSHPPEAYAVGPRWRVEDEVVVVVDQPGYGCAAVQTDDARTVAGQRCDLVVAADSGNSVTRHRQGLHHREIFVYRKNLPVQEHGIGAFLSRRLQGPQQPGQHRYPAPFAAMEWIHGILPGFSVHSPG